MQNLDIGRDWAFIGAITLAISSTVAFAAMALYGFTH
jgi:hypothetical protein